MVAKKTGRNKQAKLPVEYVFRRVFAPAPGVREGCLGVWQVLGGSDTYQIALEGNASGRRQLQCTCPDYVYRSEPLGRSCKHVIALIKTHSVGIEDR